MLKKFLKKNFLFLIMFLGFISFSSIAKINAAYPYSWTIDGERIQLNSSNSSNTASWVSDTKYQGGILTLNNYNGGQLKISCNGTSLGHVFAIKLVGDNSITVEKGVAIVADAPITFIGDGKLTINAAVPIGSGNIINSDYTGIEIDKANYSNNTTLTIENSVINHDENTINDSQKDLTDNEKNSKKEVQKISNNDNFFDSDLFKMIILAYCVISLIIMIILIAKIASKKNI